MSNEPTDRNNAQPHDDYADRSYYFEHERLDCYRLAADVVRWLGRHTIDEPHLRDQATRAAQSIVLNIAEGCGRTGKSRRHHYSIARGSAAELSAALDLVPADTVAQQQKLRRINMMLWAMTR